jgi:Nif-specific regulatory protein
MADRGTLFLDEIGEISPAFQAKLLRVLQEGEFERVGGNRTLKVNVRLVTATNRNLEEAVAKGTFRADLYYRISVVSIFVPPLRDRRSDIPMLATEFLHRFNQENKTTHTLSASAVEVLTSCYFPGNVRELDNCIRRTATMAQGDTIRDVDFACRNDEYLSSVLWKVPLAPAPDMGVPLPILPAPARSGTAPPTTPPKHQPPLAAPATPSTSVPLATSSDPEDIAEHSDTQIVEREPLVVAMERSGWVKAKAARLLGVTPRQVTGHGDVKIQPRQPRAADQREAIVSCCLGEPRPADGEVD